MNQREGSAFDFWSMVLLGINGIVGSGIFLLPGQVMHLAGHWSMVVYLFVTLLVLAIAWCFAQCASLFDRNGGAYVYAKEAFGDFIGFEIGLMRWAIGILAWASLIVGFVTALGSIWPEALHEPFRSLLILGLVGCLGILNITGVKLFKQLNNLVTIAKVLPLLLFVLFGVFYFDLRHMNLLPVEEIDAKSFGGAALILLYAFGGFETLVVVAGEMKNPQKHMPAVVMLVIAFCSLLYFLIQLIAVGILGEALAHSVVPLADAGQLLLGPSGGWFVTIAMLISIGGVNLASSFITPRSGVALAEDGLIPSWIAYRGRYGTPIWAIAVTMGLTVFLAMTGSFAQLVAANVVARFAQYFTTCLAAYILHRRRGNLERRSKRYLFMIVPAFALTGLVWLLCQATPLQLVSGLGALVLAVPLYWIQRRGVPATSHP